MPIAAPRSVNFAEQLEFFRQKLNLPTERWDDVVRAAHDRAFVVAGAATADLLDDLRQAVGDAVAGESYPTFHDRFMAIAAKHGWTGWTGEGTPAGEAWRTRVIYQTNLSTSYAAGRWAQLNSPGLSSLRPYWRYVHADGVRHPRPLHLAWNGLVLHKSDPFWQTHFPPNGWMCHCRVTAVDQRTYEAANAQGKTSPPEGWDEINPKTGAPRGIDKSFDYAPGSSVRRPLQALIDEKLVRLASPVGAALYEAMRPILATEARAAFGEFVDAVLADPIKRGRTAVAGAIDPDTLAWLAQEKAIEPASAEILVQDGLLVGPKAARHGAAGNALTAEEWKALPEQLEDPEQILFDTVSGKLLYVFPAPDGRAQKLAVEFDYLIKRVEGKQNMVVSAFKVDQETIEGGVRGGVLERIK